MFAKLAYLATISSRVGCLALVVFLLDAFWFSVTEAAVQRTILSSLVVFEFDVPKDSDDFTVTVKEISMKLILQGFRKNRSVGKVLFVPRNNFPSGEVDYESYAKKMGAKYYVGGRFKPVKDSVILSAMWANLDFGYSDEQLIVFGKDDLADFTLIEKKIEKLSNTLVLNLLRRTPPGEKTSEELVEMSIQISCFRGGKSVGFPHLDRQATLTLPFLLKRELRKKLNPKSYSVKGYSETEYNKECLKKLSKERPEIRYIISGEIINSDEPIIPGKSIIVATRFADQAGDRNIPLGMGLFSKREIEKFPSKLAHYLAQKIAVVIGQEKLNELGYDPGDIDGRLGTKTREALRLFQKDKKLEITKRFDKKTLSVLTLQ